MACHLCDSAKASGDLQSLFQVYRRSLPRLKQGLVSETILNRPPVFPGLIGYQDGEPVAALLWRFLDPHNEVATVDFYVESPRASAEAVQQVLHGFLEKTPQARTTCFELWTAPNARIHGLLPSCGFICRKRRLMRFSGPCSNGIKRNDIELRALNDIDLSLEALDSLAELLCHAYTGTPDAAFYEHLYTHPHGQRYLLGAIASPVFDFRHSFLAFAGSERQPVGLALCFQWAQAGTLYIEQIAVHRQHQGQGLGRALLSRILNAVRNEPIVNVLLTVSDENAGACRLYESAGFSLVEMERAYLKRPGLDPSTK